VLKSQDAGFTPTRPLLLAGLVIAASILFHVSQASAWNGEAHQLVAWIAEERLSDKAKAGVKELLENAEITDAEVVGWADQIRRERRESAPWHYVNIPVDAKGYDHKRDGKDGDTVIGAIERFTKILANPKVPREKRVEALKFVVHFIGDLHQPLHCVDRTGTRAATDVLCFSWSARKL